MNYSNYNKKQLIILDDKIIFEDNFNEPIYAYLNILSLRKIISFGKNFNQNIAMIPNNVEKIFLGKNFQKSIVDIPSTIRSITFANDSIFFNLLDYLHNELRELILGDEYNLVITKFPYNLNTLVLGKNYGQRINIFPNNLKYLDIGESYTEPLDNLPESLETLIIGGKFNNFIKYPSNLKYLIIKKNSLFNKELENLPSTLIYLSIQNNYIFPINKLNDSILCLSLGDYYNGTINNFPLNLHKLILSENFNYDFMYLPPSIEIIETTQNYKHINSLIYRFPNIKVIIK